MTNDNTTCNGWTNWETWKVALEIFDGIDGYHCPETCLEIAEEVMFEGVSAKTMAESVIDAFLSEVNWDEISEHTKEEEE